uniref:hypothetical protein n=1 Tax=Algoriphagus sp. TaxID=1872435 RepID=UPI00258CA1DE
MGNLLRAGILFLFLSILLPQLHAQQLNDYRSSTSGNWASASTWERFDGADWVTATAAPTSFDGAITIQNTHTVTVAATASADQITVESGGILALSSTLSLSDGAGTDLLIQGNFNWNSGTLGGVGTIEVANGGVFSLLTTSTKTIRSTLTNNGTIDWQDGILNSSVAIQLINNQTFNISGNNTLGGAGSQLSVVNNGTINKTSTGITECSPGGPFSNNGTLNFNAGIFRVSGNNSWVNAGNLNHDGGSFEFAVSSGSFFNFAGSAIGGTGTFKINSGTLELNSN